MSEPLYKDAPKGVETGYLGYLTPEQETVFNEVKQILAEKSIEYTDDYEVLRFCRARKFETEKVVEMITKYKKWYKEDNIGQYPEVYPPRIEVLDALIPHAFHGYDKEGHPIYIERAGCIDPAILTAQVTDKQILQAHIWGQEHQIRRCREAAKARNLPEGAIERFTTIMDLKGLGMHHRACLKFTQLITQYDEAFYPERMGYVLIVNPTFAFNFLWGIAKMWLDPVTKSKIVVVKDKDYALLHEYVDKDQLPTCYGGTCEVPGLEDPDMDAIRATYLNDDQYKDKYTTLIINKGKKESVTQAVKAGHVYQYCFRSNEKVKFTTWFFPEGVALDDYANATVVNNEGVMSNEWPNLGCYFGDHDGTLVLQWENDNWWGDKEIKYAIISEDVSSVASTAEIEDALKNVSLEEQ